MNYETLVFTKKDDIATVILNRPDVHNAMNEKLMRELTDCFRQLTDDTSVSVVVLTGNGKSFCAGADLTWMKNMVNYSPEENQKDSRLLLDMYETIHTCSKPVIGRINGHAFGGGIGLFAVCDITITVPETRFGFSEVKLGIIPAVISTFVALRMTPASMRRLFITGERFDAQHAKEIGLIDLVVPSEKLDETVQTYIEQIRSSGPKAIKEVKHLIDALQKMDTKTYKEFTVEKISKLRISQEGQEGIKGFLEKRKPNWKR
ncbi:MAG: enoyl-CoA hydratase/isomerase family protein [Candidatus Thermoplasmatota archaeon]|nr:enoyl-CoA hydratase/isomerase family protein [Candidatus Thermoplasmatota archaeon]